MPFLFTKNLSKSFKTSSGEFYALKNINLSFDKAGFVAIVGKSGSGKSTLLNLLLEIEKPTEGEIFYKDKNIFKYKEKELSKYRNNEVGVIFQHYNLFIDLSVIENIIIPSLIKGIDRKKAINEASRYLNEFGLDYLKDRKINNLSGGEKQRIAIIRALMNNTNVILCDEPTGALDEQNSLLIMDILKKISLDKLVIIVSHNKRLVDEYCSRIITLEDGGVISDENRYEIKPSQKKNNKEKLHKQKWTNIFTNKHIKKNIVKNLLTFTSTVFGLVSTLVAVGFNNGIEETSELAIQNNLAITVAEVSKKEYISIDNSPLQYEKSLRPRNEELTFLYNEIPSISIEPNISYFIPYVPTIKLGKEVLNGITFLPINSRSSIVDFQEVIVNDKAAELIGISKENLIGANLKFSTSVSPSIKVNNTENPIVKDDIEINLDLTITEVVDEFSFLNTPKIYYSYPLFLEYISSIRLDNISEYQKNEVSALDFIISSSDDSLVSAYSQYIFVNDINDVSKLFSLKEELDRKEELIRIESNVYSIKETYVTFMTSFSSSLEVFIILSFIGVCFIIGITSLSSFVSNKKESAILTILGARNKEVQSIFVNESLSVVLLSLLTSFALSYPTQLLVNKLVKKFAGIPDIISIPYSSFLGYPYLLPIVIFTITITVTLIFILTPLLIYKKISLSNELKDE